MRPESAQPFTVEGWASSGCEISSRVRSPCRRRRAQRPRRGRQRRGDQGARGAQAVAWGRHRSCPSGDRVHDAPPDCSEAIARLSVDVQNVTEVRVYEAAGMRVSRRFDVTQRPLG